MPLKFNPDGLPTNLKEAGKRFCNCNFVDRGTVKKKVPITLQGTGIRNADKTNTTHWNSLNECIERVTNGHFDGIGIFVNSSKTKNPEDGFDDLILLDWDIDKDTGELPEGAMEEIMSMGSYAERSPSGGGHVIAKIPEGFTAINRKKNGREMYYIDWYFTVTGGYIEGTPKEIRPANIEALNLFMDRLEGEKQDVTLIETVPLEVIKNTFDKPHGMTIGSLEEAIKRCTKIDTLFSQIYDGDISVYKSPSEADLALCTIAARATENDPFLISEIWKSSKLWREKGERADYHANTISKAITDATARKKADAEKKNPPGVGATRDEQSDKITLNETDSDEYIINETTKSIISQNNASPRFFRQGDNLIQIVPNSKELKAVKVREFYGIIGEYVTFQKKSRENTRYPLNISNAIFESELFKYSLPNVKRATTKPIIHGDGSIFDTTGYDHSTERFCICDPFGKLTISDSPTAEEVNMAITCILDVFSDFPFADTASRDNAIALLFTCAMRESFNAPAPMAVITKVEQGAGGSTLAQVPAMILYGEKTPIRKFPSKEDAMERYLASLESKTVPIVIFDNVKYKMDSEALSIAITDMRMEANAMYKHDTKKVDLDDLVFVAVANGMTLSDDLTERSYGIELTNRKENYKHKHFDLWILENRKRLLEAVYTIIRAWILAGKPKFSRKVKTLDRFPAWLESIGGIMQYAGFNEFLQNTATFQHETNVERETIPNLTKGFHILFHIPETYDGGKKPATDKWFKLAEVWPKGFTDGNGNKITNTDFMECLPLSLLDHTHNEGAFFKTLRYTLRGKEGRYGDYILEKSETTRGGSQLWRVTKSSREEIDTYISQE